MDESLWQNIGDAIVDGLANIGNWLLVALTQLLYFLVSCCYTLLDLAQLIFRLIAGLDTYALGGQEIAGETIGNGIQLGGSGDIFFQIIKRTFIIGDDTYSVIAIAFWSLVVLSCILLFITTIAAMIKSEVATGKDGKVDNSKKGIIGSAIKALLYFVIVPVSCYFGIWLGNVVLFVIDDATSPQTTSIVSIDENVREGLVNVDGSYNYYMFWGQEANTTYTSVSGLINKICLFQSNRIRSDENFYLNIINNTNPSQDPNESTVADDGTTYNFGIIIQSTQESAATLVDELFMLNAKLANPQVLASYDYTSVYGNASGSTIEHFDRNNVALVSYYYDITKYNIILALLFIFTGGKVLLTMSFSAMHRIITLLAMMFAEPITLSFMPLDKGDAFSKWRKSFISNVISLYVLVLVMNVFYIVAPIFQTFTFFSNNMDSLAWADMVIQSAFIIAALMSISGIEKMFSGFLGGESIMGAGESTMKGVSDTAKSLVGLGMGAANLGINAVHLGMHTAGLASNIVGGVGHLGAGGIKAGLAVKDSIQTGITKHGMKKFEKNSNASDADINKTARENALKNVRRDASRQYRNYSDANAEFGKYDLYEQAMQKNPTQNKWTQDEWMANTGLGSYADAQVSGMSEREYFDKYVGGSDRAFDKWRNNGQQTMLAGGLAEMNDGEFTLTDAGLIDDTAGSVKRGYFGGMSEEEYINSQYRSAEESINNADENSEIYQSYKKGVEDAIKEREEARKAYEQRQAKANEQHDRALNRWKGSGKSFKYIKDRSYKKGKEHVKGMKDSAMGTIGGIGGMVGK